MEFIGYDANLVRTAEAIEPINVQWGRRYHEAGSFQIQVLASKWDPSIAYIKAQGRPEFGMVEKLEVTREIRGTFLLVSGQFCEGLLNWKITHPKHSSTGNVAAACKALVATLVDDANVMVLTEADIGEAEPFDSDHEKLGEATFAVLKKQGMSQRICFNEDLARLEYSVWKGLDRTQHQSVNTYATFSQRFGNVDELSTVLDSSNIRNYAIVSYDNNGVEAFMEVDLRSGNETKRILNISSPISKEEMTEQEYLNAIESDARTQLQEYENIKSLEAKARQTNLIYRVDYDLGDLCIVREDQLQMSFETRIIGVDEVWKGKEHTVEILFGDKIPTIYRRAY